MGNEVELSCLFTLKFVVMRKRLTRNIGICDGSEGPKHTLNIFQAIVSAFINYTSFLHLPTNQEVIANILHQDFNNLSQKASSNATPTPITTKDPSWNPRV